MTEPVDTGAETQPPADGIRRFEGSADDFEKIWQMWHAVFPEWPISRNRLHLAFSMNEGREVIHEHGFCLAHLTVDDLTDSLTGKIMAVGVLPEHRGKGLGTALVTRAVAELKSRALEKEKELKSIEVGSYTPRFWPQMPADFPQEVKDFFVHRGRS